MKVIWPLAAAALAVSVWSDIVARQGEYGEWWYPVPGFFALLGLAGCIAIVVVSKVLGHRWLQRKDDYYGEDGSDD